MLRVPQRCAEGPEAHDTLRPYPFAGSLTLVSPETRRRGLLPGVCPPDSSNSLESPFDKGGLRGFGGQRVDDGHEDGAGGFRFALPTLHVDSRLRGNDKTGAAERCRGLGCPPDSKNSLESPFDKGELRGFEGQGLDSRHEDGAGGFCLALPTLHVDSSLRGNDKTGAAERCRGLGCPQIPLFSSPKSGGQGVEKWHPGQPRQWPPALATTHREALTFYSVPDPGHRIPDTRGKQPC
jgi:hypothetical protein